MIWMKEGCWADLHPRAEENVVADGHFVAVQNTASQSPPTKNNALQIINDNGADESDDHMDGTSRYTQCGSAWQS